MGQIKFSQLQGLIQNMAILWILNHMNDLYVKYLQVRGNFFCTLKSYHVLSQNHGFENNRPEFQSEIGY